MSISCNDVCDELIRRLTDGETIMGDDEDHAPIMELLAKAIVLKEPVRLVVWVKGGVVQRIMADEKDDVVQVVLYDLDNMEEGDEPGLFPTDWKPTQVADAFVDVEDASDN